MKIPPGIHDPKGQAAKGLVYLEVNGEDASMEYGLTVDGNHSTCYVLVASEDVITANVAINSGVLEEFADLVVDGVLRNTRSNSRGSKVFRYTFDRAVYTGVLIGETKKGKNLAKMKVIGRDSSKDLKLQGERKASKVGSIEIQIFRKVNTERKTSANANLKICQRDITKHGSGSDHGSGDAGSGHETVAGETRTALPSLDGVCQREPNFKKYSTWQDLNTYISTDVTPPSFEIGFFERNKHFQSTTLRILEDHTTDYKLWTSFTFLLRSTAELRALGFNNVPLRASLMSAMNTQSETDGADASKTETAVLAALQTNAEETLFIPREDEPVQPAVSPKQVTANKELDAGDSSQEGDIPLECTAAPAKESKTHLESESKLEDKRPETKEERIARQKIELVLPGVKSAPAHQVYMQRAPTEEPEEVPMLGASNDGEAPLLIQSENSLAKDLADDVQNVSDLPQLARLQSTSMNARSLSSPPSINMMRTRSVSNMENIPTSSIPDFCILSLAGQAPPDYRNERSTSGSAVSISVPPKPHNLELQTYNITPPSNPLPAPDARMSPTDIPERRLSLLSMTSKSGPASPSYRQDQICSASDSPSFSGASTINVPQRQFSHPVSPSQVRPQSYHTSHERDISSTPASSRMAVITRSSAPVINPGLPTSESNIKIFPKSEASNTESVVTIDQMDPYTQLEPQDIQMQGTTRPTIPEPRCTQKYFSTQSQSQDFQRARPLTPSQPQLEYAVSLEQGVEMFGTTKISSQMPSEVETEIATQPNEVLQGSRISSTFPSEISTIPTEVAPEESSSSSVQKEVTYNSNDHTVSRAESTDQSFHHAEESPILGSSQRLIAARETTSMKPPTIQARYTMRMSVTYETVLTFSKYDGETTVIQPKKIARSDPAGTSLVSPPASTQKRKANHIGGGSLDAVIPPSKIPHVNTDYQPRIKGVVDVGGSDGKERRWEDEILRLEQVARARKAAAEQKRMELQGEYAAALQVRREREKVLRLNEEAERIERENAQLQNTITRLYHGDSA